jgi:hypothetical protein
MTSARLSWTETEPDVLQREQEAMAQHAPDMVWSPCVPARRRELPGWRGEAPRWPAQRAEPRGLDQLLGAKRLKLMVAYPEGFPMVEPVLIPADPEIPPVRRTMHDWHVMGDGSLCLSQRATDWQPGDTAADLVVKAAGWFIEYRLLEEGKRDSMTERGLVNDDQLDDLIEAFA